MDKIIGIYKITNPKGRIYIGQSKDIYHRWTYYKRINSSNRQPRLFNSLKKYGANKHIFEIVHQCEEFQLNELEKYYVDLFQTFNTEHGMNLKDGGNHLGRHSDETRKKIGDAHRGKTIPEEMRRHLSIMNTGKKVSQETKDKISKSSKGKIFTPERIANMKKSWKPKVLTEESLRKMRLNATGNKHSLGRFPSEKTKNKMSESKAYKTILNIETGVFYNTLRQAAETINMKRALLKNRLNGSAKNNTSFIYT